MPRVSTTVSPSSWKWRESPHEHLSGDQSPCAQAPADPTHDTPTAFSHFLPTDQNSAPLRDDYEAFLTWRQEQLWKRIQYITGVREAADLEADAGGLE